MWDRAGFRIFKPLLVHLWSIGQAANSPHPEHNLHTSFIERLLARMGRSDMAPSGAAKEAGMGLDPAVSPSLRFLTFREAVAVLRVSGSWLYKACESRRIPFTKIGNRIIFDVDALSSWIRANSNLPKA